MWLSPIVIYAKYMVRELMAGVQPQQHVMDRTRSSDGLQDKIL
jgi:hypothetical protein